MSIKISGAREHNLKNVDVEFGDGLTVVTGVSGSGKSSLVFDTLHHEAERHFMDLFASGASSAAADVGRIDRLKPTVAIGQDLLNRNPASTLASASGLHPFLRLLYTNFSLRSCRHCDAPIEELSDDDIVALLDQTGEDVHAKLVQASRGSHATLLAGLQGRFGAAALRIDGEQARTSPELDPSVPHSIDLRLPVASGRPRDTVTAARGVGALALDINGRAVSLGSVCSACGRWFAELSPVHFKTPCGSCDGRGCAVCKDTGLHEEAARARWQGLNIAELLDRSVDEASALFDAYEAPPSAQRLTSDIRKRLEALTTVGLGYLQLNRPAPSLSRGEGQRVRLATALTSSLEEIVHILDEPTIGLHASDVQRLMPAFRDLPGPVIYVEHDRIAAAAADEAIDVGPGAGTDGGRIVFLGTPADLWNADSASGRFFSLGETVALPDLRPPPTEFLVVEGADHHNLRAIDVRLAMGRLNVLAGVSGSGKTSLLTTLVDSLKAGEGVGCEGISGPGLKPISVDQSPIGKNPRSNPATYTKLADIVRDAFASATDLSPSHFSFNRQEGACPVCEGMGATEMKLRYLPSSWVPCDACGGSRFSAEVRAARIKFGGRELSIVDFLELSVDEARDLIADGGPFTDAGRRAASRILDALNDIGLGYVKLNQPSPSLSGGEAQRVKLAKYLSSRTLSGKLLVLDEPTTGLHPKDVAGLLVVLDRLVRRGGTVVVVEHDLDLIRAADWVVELGPGSGPRGGDLVYEGPLDGLTQHDPSPTGRVLLAEGALSPRAVSEPRQVDGDRISIRRAATNNLKNIDVDIPKGCLTVVTGVSGSGKSSLVRDLLESEARRRYLESLSMYERQGVREGPQADVDTVSGLGVTLPMATARSASTIRVPQWAPVRNSPLLWRR